MENQNISITIPNVIPILPVRNAVLFPQMAIPLTIGREESQLLVQDAINNSKLVGIVGQRKTDIEKPTLDDLYTVGTVARFEKLMRFPDGHVGTIAQGLKRFHILELVSDTPYIQAQIEVLEITITDDQETEALLRNLHTLATKMIELTPNVPPEVQVIIMNIEEPLLLLDVLTGQINIPVHEKQDILETLDIKKAMEKLMRILNREIEVMELSKRIQNQVKGSIDKSQKEYYLRQQMKAIQEELGETEGTEKEIDELKERLEKANMPPDVFKEAMKQFNRMKSMSESSPEYSVVRTYLEWMTELPWSKCTEDKLDISEARRVLDEDHHDLEKVKRRILEYLSVRRLKKDSRGPILCFVGPPGVGKTSLGKSIARSMGREFIRMSLGGIHDEAEIRGHRRTYIGALPGKIIQELKKAGSNNPVFMLDEIDKVGADFRGDPSSALLEVLDPEQNYTFTDNYLAVPFDLSKVLFIATANTLETIIPPLRDRMEVIELPGYSEEEKTAISLQYLLPKQLKENGLTTESMSISENAIKLIIRSYTQEAGVRNLEREVGSVCRGAAVSIAEGKQKTVSVSEDDISRYLGPPKFIPEVAMRTSIPGVATGMAWTPTGGSIIFIEATKMKGSNQLILTGLLGSVMKESAQTALSFLKSKAHMLSISSESFDGVDVHIHVPSGAIPKDGPSAGVAIYTALVSLFKESRVKNEISMTGEITLRGIILPVGGIKEKVLAADRAGIKTVILPGQNEKDLEDIPQHVRSRLNIRFVKYLDDVVPWILEEKKTTTTTQAW